MSDFSLQVKGLKKNFGRRLIFEGIEFSLSSNFIFGISGANGSGKSTLIKIIAGINSPSAGEINYTDSGKKIIPEKLHNYIGFVSPYLVLYDEFSAWENLNYFSKIRDVDFDKEKVESLLNKFLLFNRRNDLLKTYSSGMKQRMKFIFALMHSPKLILLDEPTSNLDDEGKESVYEIIENEGKKNIVIIASNEKSDLLVCKEKLKLEDFKKSVSNK
jgi:heme exporter protein A